MDALNPQAPLPAQPGSDLVHIGSTTPLGVGACQLITLRQHSDHRGPLAVLGQGDAPLPFTPQRIFLVHHVTGPVRGEHAHRLCHQLLLCTHGSVRIRIDDGRHQHTITLNQPHLALHIPPMIWAEQDQHSPDAALLVLASHPYDPSDYLRSRQSWLAALAAS